MQASKASRPVHLRRYNSHLTKPLPRRSSARIPVAVWQEDNGLYVDGLENFVVTLCFQDINGDVISQVDLYDNENNVKIPDGAVSVVVYCNDAVYMGMLY